MKHPSKSLFLASWLPWIVTGTGVADSVDPVPVADDSTVAEIRAEAQRLQPFVQTPAAREFLRATQMLSNQPERIVYRTKDRGAYYDKSAFDALPEQRRANLEPVTLDESYYYQGRYGTPLAYCRALDLLGNAGVASLRGKRLFDFGYGMIGQLRLLACCGADVLGVEVNPLFPVLYGQPGDQGAIEGWDGRKGHLKLVHGQWPGEPRMRSTVGQGYDIILSKNVLKRGYIHPQREVDPRLTIDLGVDDLTFVRRAHEALNPGGFLMIYNLSPKQNPPDQPYIPWADGRSPFTRDLLESTGFTVLAFDKDDTEAVREMARILKWDASGMNLEELFGHYTLARK